MKIVDTQGKLIYELPDKPLELQLGIRNAQCVIKTASPNHCAFRIKHFALLFTPAED